MTAPDKDRITLAWELRRDLHAWLQQNPRAVMVEIIDAFAERKAETVRKDGDIAMLGSRGAVGHYSAISDKIKPIAVRRARLAIGGLKTVCALNEKNLDRNAIDRARINLLRAIRKAREAEPLASEPKPDAGKPAKPINEWVGGSIKHVGGSLPPGSAQRGQGAVRQPVTVNCFQLF